MSNQAQLTEHTTKLLLDFSQLEKIIINRLTHKPLIPFVLIAKIGNNSLDQTKRKDISSLFQFNNQNYVIGLLNNDQLMIKLESIPQLNKISDSLHNYKRNSNVISALEAFYAFQPIITIGNGDKTYKAKLINFQDNATNLDMQRLFEYTLSKQKIAYQKNYYADRLPVYKLTNASPAIIDRLKDKNLYTMLFSLEPMPKYAVAIDFSPSIDTVETIQPTQGKDYETLGILDNGIAPILQLKPWITGNRWATHLCSEINPTHGTFVAGIALYGDKNAKIDWIGHRGIRLYDATVFPDKKGGIDEDELIANIQRAIVEKHNQIKIWNLSMSIYRPINDHKFSDFAIALDDLQRKYNILICKSIGNCYKFMKNEPKGRIYEGADSVRSLAVGSIAHATDSPSSFSRIGPGPGYIIKPEVAHYGGDAGVDENGKLATIGVKSFDLNGNIVHGAGTSFSTARISSLALGLYQELGETFDPLLIKSLIIHSAAYPKNLKIPVHEKIKELGFGIPKKISDIIRFEPYEITFVLRRTLAKGECIEILDFPMPKSLIRNGFYSGQIIATLICDPILDYTQGAEYCQSGADIEFGTYDMDESNKHQTVQNIFDELLYCKNLMGHNQSNFALQERLLIQYANAYCPVKKYAVDLSELIDANKINLAKKNKLWCLRLQGRFRDHTEQLALRNSFIPSQDICVIITIRDSQQIASIYDEITSNSSSQVLNQRIKKYQLLRGDKKFLN